MSPWRIDILAGPPPDPTTPGIERAVWELAGGLAGRGHRVRVLYPTATPTPPPPYRGVPGVPVPVVASKRRPVPQALEVARATADCLEPDTDLLLGVDERAAAVRPPSRGRGPALALYLSSVPTDRLATGSNGGSPGFLDRIGGWMDLRTLRRLETESLGRAAAVWASTAATRDRLTQLHHLPSGRVRLLPPTLPDPDVSTPRAAARLALRIPQDVPVAIFVGHRPEPQGLPVALDAFRRSRVFFPGARFLVVGSSPKPDPGVLPLGVCDEATKAQALCAADLFLFPSREAGPAYAVTEAMRYGLASLVSARVVLEGAAEKSQYRAVSSDDPADYAAEFAELFADPALRRRIGDAGREYADQFSPARTAQAVEQALGSRLPA